MIFKLESKELESAEEFIDEQNKKNSSFPTAGERWAYTFIPTGLGTIVLIKDLLLKEEKDITCWDWW